MRRVRLGTYGDLTPAAARKLAEAMRGRVAAGEDPAAVRAAELQAEADAAAERKRQAQAEALTLRKLVDLWEARQLIHRSERHRREATRALRTSLPGLLDLPAAAIDAAAIRRALDAIPKPAPPRKAKDAPSGPGTNKARQANPRGKEPSTVPAIRGETMARRVRAYGAALFGWAVKRDLVPSNPFAGMPMETREVARDRVLTDAELGEVWRAAGALGWPWGPTSASCC